MKRITLVRHGQSEANITGHWQGQGDSPLSELGRSQARALAGRFTDEGWRFDRVASSDLSRARATAEATAISLGSDIVFGEQFREIDVGTWEGLSRPDVAARYPEQVQALKDGADIKVGGGESWSDLASRAERAIKSLLETMAEGGHIALFAHGGFIASAVAKLGAIARHRRTRLGHMSNTSVTTLSFERSMTIERFNDTSHLTPLGPWGQEQIKKGATVVSLDVGSDISESQYRLEEVAADIDGAFHSLSQRHPGERVTLAVPSFREESETIIGTRGVFAPSAGRAHIVLDGDHRALADYNVGSSAP